MSENMTHQRERQVGGRPSGRPTPRPEGQQPPTELVPFLKAYAREKPDVAALWCFGLGFVIGWKLKPW